MADKRKADLVQKLRNKLKERQASLADDFEYRIFFILYYKNKTRAPVVFETERVALSMTNSQEKAIMEGVRAKAYTVEEAKLLISKDTVQIHAIRWFPISDQLGGVEDMKMKVWPRTEIARMESLCFSRWKGGPDNQDPFKLMAMRFVIHQDHELSRNIVPFLVRAYHYPNKKRGGIVFNTPQNFGVWVVPSGKRGCLDMTMTSTMLCFPQEELTRWDLTVTIDRCPTYEEILDIAVRTERNKSLPEFAHRPGHGEDAPETDENAAVGNKSQATPNTDTKPAPPQDAAAADADAATEDAATEDAATEDAAAADAGDGPVGDPNSGTDPQTQIAPEADDKREDTVKDPQEGDTEAPKDGVPEDGETKDAKDGKAGEDGEAKNPEEATDGDAITDPPKPWKKKKQEVVVVLPKPSPQPKKVNRRGRGTKNRKRKKKGKKKAEDQEEIRPTISLFPGFEDFR